MYLTTVLTSLVLMSTTGWAQYSLQDDFFSGGSFFSRFEFFTGPDPTNGFVEYLSQGSAQAAGLVSGSSQIHLGVNSRDVTSTGRQSVRLTSRQSYDSGLVILDLAHMPGGICGTWPAFWMVGPDWPNNGEIDIIEGVNDMQTNQMTLHTGDTCDVGGSAMQGKLISPTCDVSDGDNSGCGIGTTDTQTYGRGFNANGGGTYATEWTPDNIAVYFWPRGREPADVTSGSPDPSGWGTPMAQFSGGCNIANSFRSQQIVFDTTFCGDWAGEVWPGSSCAASTRAATCNEYVGQNPSAFQDAYWTINSLKVYQGGRGAGSPVPSGSPSGPAHSYAPSAGPSGASPSGAAPTASGFATIHRGGHKGPASPAPSPAPSSPPTSPPAGPHRGHEPPNDPDPSHHWRSHWHPGWNGRPNHRWQSGGSAPPSNGGSTPAANFVEAQTEGVNQNFPTMPRATDSADTNDSQKRHLHLHRHWHDRL